MKADMRILLADDYEPNILMTGTFLEELGYKYDAARSGTEALEKRLATDYSLILMDVQMPEMDGLEATRRIRQAEQEQNLPAVPIIGMTGNATEEDRFFCLRAGMNDFLTKPFRLNNLEEKIKTFIAPRGNQH